MPRRRRITTARPKYRNVALRPATYEKVEAVADVLRERWGRCTFDDAIDYMVNHFEFLTRDKEEVSHGS